MKLKNNANNNKALATTETDSVNSLTHESARVKSMLTASCVEGANTRWSAQSVGKGACKVQKNVSNALMAVSEAVTDATE